VSLPRGGTTLRERKPLGDNVYDVCEINPNIEISLKKAILEIAFWCTDTYLSVLHPGEMLGHGLGHKAQFHTTYRLK
jgi:hypothetical protein